jgi:hypothetical protein
LYRTGGDFSTCTYVLGDSVIADSSYDVAHLPAVVCAGSEATCGFASTELTVATERWGNVDCTTAVVPTATDLALVVNKVKDLPGAFIEPRCQLQGPTVSGVVGVPNPLGQAANASDIGRQVDAVKGFFYPSTFLVVACPGDN